MSPRIFIKLCTTAALLAMHKHRLTQLNLTIADLKAAYEFECATGHELGDTVVVNITGIKELYDAFPEAVGDGPAAK